MSDNIQAIRGMSDLLPEDCAVWATIESRVRALVNAYGYAEIRVPVLERTDLFKRSIGEVTDIVEKEMYTFPDRNDVSVTLRPEATAGIVRAAICNGLLRGSHLRLWSAGPMFRYEKPQKGRYRQFHQIDLEIFGAAGPDVDAELILLIARLWRELDINEVSLQINNLGTAQSRGEYRQALLAYFQLHRSELDEDSRRRLERNPLRILDSKNPDMAALLAAAPRMSEHLDAESAAHFAEFRAVLDEASVRYEVNPRLVRGLDYYNRTVFEWVTDRLGAQGTVCAGGRYDALVEQLGGRPTPAVGCAIGMERLVELAALSGPARRPQAPHLFVVAVGAAAVRSGFGVCEDLRTACPAWRVEMNCGGGSFRTQMRRADHSGARVAVILGEDEVNSGTVSLKPLRNDQTQIKVASAQLSDALLAYLTDAGVNEPTVKNSG